MALGIDEYHRQRSVQQYMVAQMKCGRCGHGRNKHPRGRSESGSCLAVSEWDESHGWDWDIATDPCMCQGWDLEQHQEILPGTIPRLVLTA